MESKEQSLSKIVTALSGVNYGKDVEENHIKRIANSLESVTKEQEKSIVEILSGGSGGGGCVPITYAELKSLRDNSQLSPGTLYRITDYVATTVQEGTKSANHPFDIVVVALDEKALSEDAGAIAHSEEDLAKYKSVTWTDNSGAHTAPFLMEANITMFDNTFLCVVFAEDEDTWVLYNPQYPDSITINLSTENIEKTEDGYVIVGSPELESTKNYKIESGYFANSNLPAWSLKYCLDNDTNRFIWAQSLLAPIVDSSAFSCYYVVRDYYTWFMFRRYPEMDNKDSEQQYAYVLVNTSGSDPEDPEINWNNINPSQIIYTAKEVPEVGDSVTLPNFMTATVAQVRTGINVPGRDAGKGVIYWMKDEHNNEAPFDFKGILLLLPQKWFENNSDWVADNLFNMSPDDLWVYVFTYFDFRGLSESPTDFQSVVIDGSVIGLDDSCGYNKIMPYHEYGIGIVTTKIPINIFFGIYASEFGELSASHTQNNILNMDCNLNIFGQECSNNIFGCGCKQSKVWLDSSDNKVSGRAYELELNGTANIIMYNCRTCNVQGTHNIIMDNCQVTFSTSTTEAIIFPETGGEIDFGQYAGYQYPKFAGRGGMESTGIIQFTLDQLSLNTASQQTN